MEENILELSDIELRERFLKLNKESIFYQVAKLDKIVSRLLPKPKVDDQDDVATGKFYIPDRPNKPQLTYKEKYQLPQPGEFNYRNGYFGIRWAPLVASFPEILNKRVDMFKSLDTEWWDYDSYLETARLESNTYIKELWEDATGEST